MKVITLTKENFSDTINCGKTVLVDFRADWCAPCIALSPVIADIASENPDVFVGEVNIDEQTELADEYGISSIPTLLVFRNGEIVNAAVGLKTKDHITSMLK